VPTALIGDDELAGSGVLYWTGRNSGLKDIVDGDRIIWGD
jgi:hypothetical protein